MHFCFSVPMSKEPFTLAEYKPVDYEVTFANRTYVEHLTKFGELKNSNSTPKFGLLHC